MISRLLLVLWCALATAAPVHRSPMAGRWFPEDAKALGKLLDEAFAVAAKRTGAAPPRRGLEGIVVPHAALAYSGAIAAAAYRRLDHPNNVILLAFSHTRPVEGVMAPNVDAYATPLGVIRVNREAIRDLGFRWTAEERLCDHSLENQLPFIQRSAPEAGLIPLYVGMLNEGQLAEAGRKLAGRLAGGDVIVASSDFTHYGQAYQYTPFPNDEFLPQRLRQRTLEIFETIGSLRLASFEHLLEATHDNLCGRDPIRLLMATLAQQNEESFLKAVDYAPSGDLTRDYSLSVGYGALAFYPASAFMIPNAEQNKLLISARKTLDAFLATGSKTLIAVPPAERDADLEQRTGVFVSIKKNGALRGCVGSIAATRPLAEAVADRTLAAATEDPRFGPIDQKEGPFRLEISLLTPFKRLSGWHEFRLGYGAAIVLKGRSAILLPQVADEMHWNREQFLENLSRKAGLDAKAYRNPEAALYSYSAQVFGER